MGVRIPPAPPNSMFIKKKFDTSPRAERERELRREENEKNYKRNVAAGITKKKKLSKKKTQRKFEKSFLQGGLVNPR